MVKELLTSEKIKMTPSVVEFFAGKSVFITGASGFMGKILVEKLLRCCPLISRIYIIIRSKKQANPTERWNVVTQDVVFDRLKEEYPDALNKVTVLEGDVAKPGLGLSDSNRKILEEEVAVVFHSAASVRFNDNIRDAVLLNTRGSLEMIKLAHKMKKLKCFLYVSTTYSNSHLKVPIIEEQVYPSAHHYSTIIKLAESDNAEHLAMLTSKIIATHPNTYTFTKCLAEQIMLDYAKQLPIVIVRPSVVINTIYEPISGWVDNLNGVIGVIAGISKGVLRVFLARGSCSLDYVAVDYAINSLIVSAWHKSVFEEKSKNELAVYNCAYGNIRKATFNDMVNYGMVVATAIPHQEMLWYPSIILTTNTSLYTFLFYILQLIPAIVVDLCLSLTGSPPMLVKLNQKIYIASYALKIFSQESFVFANSKHLSLFNMLNKFDQKTFYMNPPEEMTIKRIIAIVHTGMKKYLFKDKEEISLSVSRLNRLYWADRFVRFIVLSLILWISYNFTMVFTRNYIIKYI